MRAARRSPRAALLAAIVGSAMVFIDGSAVNVALPVIQRELHAGAQGGQWVIESYSLFLSALLLVGGSLGDLFGRRLIFGIGVAVFSAGSLLCAVSPGIEWLIAGRIVAGAGAALSTPGSLALISAAYAGEARGRAIGTWSASSAMTAALGPVLGGWLVTIGSWRWVFAINLPLAVLVLIVLATRVAESRDDAAPRRVDVGGAVLATGALAAIVYGLIDAQGAADPRIVAAFLAGGAALLAAFFVVERRERNPMLRLEVFASRRFVVANLYTFLLYAALGGSLYFVPFDLIFVRGYAPAAAGGALLPFIAIMVAFSRFSGGLVARVGARLPLVAGALLAAAGYAGFAIAPADRPYWSSFFPAAVVLGCGGALFVAPLTTTVMDALDGAHAGIASGINNAVSRVAGLIAIAALGIVLAAAFGAALEHDVATAPLSPGMRALVLAHRQELFGGASLRALAGRPEGALVSALARHAYAGGFSIVMFASAALALLAAFVGADRSFARDAARPGAPAVTVKPR